MQHRPALLLLLGLAFLPACASPRVPTPQPASQPVAEPEIVPLTLEQDRDISGVRRGS